VLPSTIMNFPDLKFIVKFPNYSPVISKLTYKNYIKKANAFDLRDDLILK